MKFAIVLLLCVCLVGVHAGGGGKGGPPPPPPPPSNGGDPPTFSTLDINPSSSDGRSHNVIVNEVASHLYVVGGRLSGACSGGLLMFDATDPANPVRQGCYNGANPTNNPNGYIHDAQCLRYTGPDPIYQGQDLCFCYAEDVVTIVDVTDFDPVTISTISYNSKEYTHQGWLTDDQAYLLVDDELDESKNSAVTNTRTIVFDVTVLNNPKVHGAYNSPGTSIDHNQYVYGNRAYQAMYCDGVRILDTSNIGSVDDQNLITGYRTVVGLQEKGHIDLEPTCSNGNTYEGIWSTYTFFPDTGNPVVAANSIGRGLFLLDDNTQIMKRDVTESLKKWDSGLTNSERVKRAALRAKYTARSQEILEKLKREGEANPASPAVGSVKMERMMKTKEQIRQAREASGLIPAWWLKSWFRGWHGSKKRQTFESGDCVNGQVTIAGQSYDCNNINIRSFYAVGDLCGPGAEGNDIWGWKSMSGRSFAVVGCTTGTAFVEVTDPDLPVCYSYLPKVKASIWSDVKVLGSTVYIGADDSTTNGQNIQIVDMEQFLSATPTYCFGQGPPPAEPTPAPPTPCGEKNAACTDNGQCCSNNCKPNNKCA